MTLNADARKAIAQNIGIDFADLIDMDWDEIERRIEQKNGKRLTFQTFDDDRIPVRGSVFLALGRFIFKNNINDRINTIRTNSNAR